MCSCGTECEIAARKTEKVDLTPFALLIAKDFTTSKALCKLHLPISIPPM